MTILPIIQWIVLRNGQEHTRTRKLFQQVGERGRNRYQEWALLASFVVSIEGTHTILIELFTEPILFSIHHVSMEARNSLVISNHTITIDLVISIVQLCTHLVVGIVQNGLPLLLSLDPVRLETVRLVPLLIVSISRSREWKESIRRDDRGKDVIFHKSTFLANFNNHKIVHSLFL